MPNTVVGGNHDFDNATGEFSQYDTYFPPSRYANKAWTPSTATYGGYLGQNLFGPDPVDRRNMDNFALFTAGGRDFLVLNLEWETPQVTLDWAAKVLAAYPNRIAILATHSFVQINGLRNTLPQRPGGIPAETVWNTFVSQQCSIKLVLNGHYHDGNLGEGSRSDLNSCGQPVQQILTDYQDRANGGDGWLRYYTFAPSAGTMTASTYSPKLDQFETDADSSFTLPFDLSDPQAAPSVPVSGTRRASLAGVSTADVRIVADLAMTQAATGSGTYIALLGRAASGNSYRVKLKYPATGGLTIALARVAGSEAAIGSSALAGITPTPGQLVRVKFEVEGTSPTTLRAKAWRVGTTEPANWRVTATDSTAALQTAGTAGVEIYTSSSATAASPVTFDRFTVSRPGTTPPANQTPTAAIGTPTINGLAVGFNGSGSTDSDGTVAGYAWNFGDGTTGTGATPSHTYATAGTYIVTLTVTDNNGATGTTTRQVVLTPPSNVAPTAVIGAPTISNLTVGLSGSGSTDSDGTITGHAWNFGDSATGTGVSTSHTYAAAGTYAVTLTVTDNNGATGTATAR